MTFQEKENKLGRLISECGERFHTQNILEIRGGGGAASKEKNKVPVMIIGFVLQHTYKPRLKQT